MACASMLSFLLNPFSPWLIRLTGYLNCTCCEGIQPCVQGWLVPMTFHAILDWVTCHQKVEREYSLELAHDLLFGSIWFWNCLALVTSWLMVLHVLSQLAYDLIDLYFYVFSLCTRLYFQATFQETSHEFSSWTTILTYSFNYGTIHPIRYQPDYFDNSTFTWHDSYFGSHWLFMMNSYYFY